MSTRDQQSAPKGARDAEQTADAAPAVGQALQDQIGQALQPAMDVLRDQLTATVRRELEEQLHQPGQVGQSAKARLGDRPSTERAATSQRESSRDDSDSDETTEARLLDRPELGRALQEQISRAVQPAMAEFREQMAATVRHEVDESLHRDRSRAAPDTSGSTSRASEDQEAASDQADDESLDRASSKGSDASETRAGQAPGKPLLASLPVILEQQGEQWLRAQLDQGIDLLFSVWVRAAVQQEVERALQRVTRVGIELVADRATRDELRAQSEKTVERVVERALDRLFADEVRDDLKARGHQAIGALFHPDVKAIVQQAQELLLSLIEGLIAVLRECWDQILQFLTRVVLALVQPRLTGMLKDTLGSLATTSGRERGKQDAEGATAGSGERSEPRRSSSDDAGDEPREDARDRDRPRQRASDEDEPDDVGSNGAGRRPGRAPSGRPTSGRPSGSRQGSGRSLSDRSASGRPSRAASR